LTRFQGVAFGAPDASIHRALIFFTLQRVIFRPQLLVAFVPQRVQRDALDGADDLALGLVEVADALRALARIDLVDHLAHRDRGVWTLRLADVAVDALIGDE
jgi:hypothetical protein